MSRRVLALIIHPDPAVRRRIARVTRSAGALPVLAATTFEAVRLLDKRPPAVIISKAEIDDGAAVFDAVAMFRDMCPKAYIVVLSKEPTVGLAVRSMRAGANDVIAAPDIGDAVFLAINSAVAPEVPLLPSNASPASPALPQLGEDSIRLLGMLSDGLTNKQVATRIACSEKTIERRLRGIRTTLGVRSRGELIAHFARLQA